MASAQLTSLNQTICDVEVVTELSKQTASGRVPIPSSPFGIEKTQLKKKSKSRDTKNIRPVDDSGYYKSVTIKPEQVLGTSFRVSAYDVTAVVDSTTKVCKITYLYHRQPAQKKKKTLVESSAAPGVIKTEEEQSMDDDSGSDTDEN